MKISNEIKIALTAIAAGVLLFLGINFLKGINVFKSSNSYYVRFKDAKGLTVSSKVFANGYPVARCATLSTTTTTTVAWWCALS